MAIIRGEKVELFGSYQLEEHKYKNTLNSLGVCAYFGLPFKAYSQHRRRDGLLISLSSKCINLTALEAIPQPLISLPPPLHLHYQTLCVSMLFCLLGNLFVLQIIHSSITQPSRYITPINKRVELSGIH